MKKSFIKKIVAYCSPLLLFILLGSSYYGGTHTDSGTGRKGFALKVPVSFNKTHFIVGLSATPVQHRDEAINQAGYETVQEDDGVLCNKAYFSPDDDLQQKLIDLINSEQEEISLAIYAFTNKKIADALMAAHQRGVRIEIVVDPGFLSDRYTKIGLLHEHGIIVYMYNPQQSPTARKKSMSNIMHNKFVLFKKNLDNQTMVWTGSFNFTNSAHLSNQENVVVLNYPSIVRRYEHQFRELKKRAMLYQPH
jgi:phosphatidylserine/phosphatidylglycerophosphate/cardiolipin synthase-like enzyme